MREALEVLPEADVYVLEEQSHRAVSTGFLGISVQLRCLEATLYTLLSQQRRGPVHSLLPTRVAGYFGIKGSKAGKKKAAVDLVRVMAVEQRQATPLGEEVQLPGELVEFFQAAKKKDDLSDSLLQAVALLDWSTMSKHLQTSPPSH